MNRLPDPTRQDLNITWRALLAIKNNHRLPPEDLDALRRVLVLLALRYSDTNQPHQDLHP